MRAYMSGTDPNFEGVSRLDGVDAALSQDAPVKKGVAGPIGEFDKAEALFGTEPLDDAMD